MKEIEITVPVNLELSKKELYGMVARAMGITPESVGEALIIKRSIDARGKNVLYRLKVEGYKKGEEPVYRYKEPFYKNVREGKSVIIIGAGPAGICAALKLLERGYKPVIIERGKDVHQRKSDIAKLSREQFVDPDSNYCFGEGEFDALYAAFGKNPFAMLELIAEVCKLGRDELEKKFKKYV